MIDCHAHISHSIFDKDRESVIERAQRAGVNTIIAVGEDIHDSRRILKTCREQTGILPCLGIHPDAFADDRNAPSEKDIADIVTLIQENRENISGIGEVGLDYRVVESEERRLKQRAFLSQMVQLSIDLSLPLNVHCRSAGHYTLDLLANCKAQKVLMHAFDGKATYAVKAFEDHRWIFSIPPSIIRSAQKQKLVKALPLDALALESDSPVLGPDPNVRNEPANIVHVVRCIAEIKRVSEEKVEEITTQNAKKLFGISNPH